METVFLSFHFNPRSKLVALAEDLLASHGLLVITGIDLGGGELFPEIRQRIRAADAFVSILTKDRDVGGSFEPARWVEAELQDARGIGKPTLALVESGTVPSPVSEVHEFAPFESDNPLPAIMKLTNTIGIWQGRIGRTIRVRIPAKDLEGVDDDDLECSYQLRHGTEKEEWQKAELFPEPGEVFVVFVRGVRPDSFFRVRVKTPFGVLQSPFSPQDVTVELKKVP